MSQPDEEGCDGSGEEVPVDCGVGAHISEYPTWPNQTPDDGRVVEDVIGWAGPWAV